ncbi:MAG TPA: flavin-dependent oxidoreductase [Amycolatopsis sp.]|uniref:flavin-dependent oxidoreductase n=1 Tax=Amycolatopsis sp. TaxID=37632 RepID=UPI002B4A53FA|nr:flavin-dependent oxidoreductase [Amycolatopsis sp.]HKS46110.1 flavin-dependent oxidoreductase [Amycolatopsis sp.]
MRVVIVGAGIAGLTLALELHDAGIECRVYEAAPEILPMGVGINVLPHATKVLGRLGLESALAEVAVTTRESVFYNRFGQMIYREPAGRFAGYSTPQFSIHRGELQTVLLQAVRERLGSDAVVLGHVCHGASQDERCATAHFRDPAGVALPAVRGDVVLACDGVHSTIRKQLHPEEGEPLYTGVNMWRGTTVMPPILTGASMIRAGWLAGGKMVIYPIRDDVDGQGNQLVNWVAELQTERHERRDWTRRADVGDFLFAFETWRFDWLDVPEMVHHAGEVLEYPMVDQDPLGHWTVGRLTLVGDAAHPMVPRGSNGAGQAILDAHALRTALVECADPVAALRRYEEVRLPATARVVRTNRVRPPDAILREVWERTGDRPFERIEDVISLSELQGISDSYKEVAGYSRAQLADPA